MHGWHRVWFNSAVWLMYHRRGWLLVYYARELWEPGWMDRSSRGQDWRNKHKDTGDPLPMYVWNLAGLLVTLYLSTSAAQ